MKERPILFTGEMVREFRDFCLSLLKYNISMSSKNEYYSTQTMITKLSKLMNTVRNWYWG
ncbi:MAG: hypothetical protein ACK41T_00750 [Pseudobdellovibrio sp.]